MRVPGRRKSIAFFITLGSCLVAVAVALNVWWILLTPRQIALLVLGVVFFSLIIAGLILNTIFLVREIRRNEEQDSFLNAVTHELKTPIASIRLYLETLQTRNVDEAKRQEFYEIMLADNDRLLNTVEQVLRAARTGHRNRSGNTTFVNLAALMRECLATTRTRHPSLDAGAFTLIENTRHDVPPLVRGDADELRAAIANLIDNAVKYSSENVRVRCEVDTLTAPLKVIVRVADNGIGIPPDQLKNIFKRFHRVLHPGTSRTKGTGLGLFIVRAIIKKHRGQVVAASHGIGRGSTFTIQLPRAHAPHTLTVEQVAARQQSNNQSNNFVEIDA
ncbi:MAG: HAMP domain-containing histidine kinase [Pyrinomonadaceae bacterium MAG19_C2-C3]|nr:HAMP domain-containing histidine kinase [Pyrinomonadaceae bacterium MAG19_C2-C3]